MKTTIIYQIYMYLVLWWLKSGLCTCSNYYEGMQKVTFDTGRRKWCIISFHKNYTNNVVAYVTFPLQL